MSRYFVIISDDEIGQLNRLSSAQRIEAIDLIKQNLIVLNKFNEARDNFTELVISLDNLSGVPSIAEFTPQTNLSTERLMRMLETEGPSERARGAVGLVAKIAAEFRATEELTSGITGATSTSDRSRIYAAYARLTKEDADVRHALGLHIDEEDEPFQHAQLSQRSDTQPQTGISTSQPAQNSSPLIRVQPPAAPSVTPVGATLLSSSSRIPRQPTNPPQGLRIQLGPDRQSAGAAQRRVSFTTGTEIQTPPRRGALGTVPAGPSGTSVGTGPGTALVDGGKLATDTYNQSFRVVNPDTGHLNITKVQFILLAYHPTTVRGALGSNLEFWYEGAIAALHHLLTISKKGFTARPGSSPNRLTQQHISTLLLRCGRCPALDFSKPKPNPYLLALLGQKGTLNEYNFTLDVCAPPGR